MSVTITRILVEGIASNPNQAVTITDQATGIIIGSGSADGTGAFTIPVMYGTMLSGIAAGSSWTQGVLFEGQQSGAAGGVAAVSGTLTQALPLGGSAGGVATAGPSEPLVNPGLGGTAGGTASPSGTLQGGNLPLAGTAAGVAAPSATELTVTAGGAQSLGLPNPGFESAIGSVEGDNWWPAFFDPGNQGDVMYADRVTSGAIAGTYSGRVSANGYVDNGGDPFNLLSIAYLRNRTTKTALEASSGHLKFKIKPTELNGTCAFVEVAVYNSGGTLISSITNSVHMAMLWGTRWGTASDDTSIRIASPGVGTTYDVDFDLLAHCQAITATWASAAVKVIVYVAMLDNATGTTVSALIDSFEAQ